MGLRVRRGFRAILALFTLALALLAWQGIAAAALTPNSASLSLSSGGTGAQAVATPPGGVLSATLRVKVTGSSWRGTKWQVGGGGVNCADTADRGSGNDQSASFNVTAPGKPDEYDSTFTPTGANDCAGEQGSSLTLPKSIKVTT